MHEVYVELHLYAVVYVNSIFVLYGILYFLLIFYSLSIFYTKGWIVRIMIIFIKSRFFNIYKSDTKYISICYIINEIYWLQFLSLCIANSYIIIHFLLH